MKEPISTRRTKPSQLPRALLLCQEELREKVYPQNVVCQLEAICELDELATDRATFMAVDKPFAGVRFLFSTWGCPELNERHLALLPDLEAVFYAAGSIRHMVTDTFWKRNIPIMSAWALNAIPVAEFTFAQIILCLKKAYITSHVICQNKRWMGRQEGPLAGIVRGTYGGTIGLISYGQIARLVRERLRTMDVRVLVYDPYLSPGEAADQNVQQVSLEEMFERAEVISVHTPWLPETEGLVSRELLASMRPGAAIINTARGAIIDEAGLIEVLQQRADMQAVLDVTYPEPPEPDSPLYTLPNVFLTPHIAGSVDRECARMGLAMVEECQRLLNGQPLRFSISEQKSLLMA